MSPSARAEPLASRTTDEKKTGASLRIWGASCDWLVEVCRKARSKRHATASTRGSGRNGVAGEVFTERRQKSADAFAPALARVVRCYQWRKGCPGTHRPARHLQPP